MLCVRRCRCTTVAVDKMQVLTWKCAGQRWSHGLPSLRTLSISSFAESSARCSAHCYHRRIATLLLVASRDTVPATVVDSSEQWAVTEQPPRGLLEGCRCRGGGGTDHECTLSSRLGRSWAPRPAPPDAPGRRGCNAFAHFQRRRRGRALASISWLGATNSPRVIH